GPFTGSTNAAGQFQVTFTSNTAGTVTGHASSTLSVAGSAAFTVQTDGIAPNSGDAVKTFVPPVEGCPFAPQQAFGGVIGSAPNFCTVLHQGSGTMAITGPAGQFQGNIC